MQIEKKILIINASKKWKIRPIIYTYKKIKERERERIINMRIKIFLKIILISKPKLNLTLSRLKLVVVRKHSAYLKKSNFLIRFY